MRDLQKTDSAQYDKLIAELRRATTEYNREYGEYDAETIAAVDKFRAEHDLNYQGDAAGLVDARLVDALRAAYYARTKRAPGKE